MDDAVSDIQELVGFCLVAGILLGLNLNSIVGACALLLVLPLLGELLWGKWLVVQQQVLHQPAHRLAKSSPGAVDLVPCGARDPHVQLLVACAAFVFDLCAGSVDQ